MRHEDLPTRWKTKVIEWIRTFADDTRERFGAGDFSCSHDISITFEDGSTAEFRYGILIEAPELNEIGIFTEHCGYHIFPLRGTTSLVSKHKRKRTNEGEQGACTQPSVA